MKNKLILLEKAIQIAVSAHTGQFDKAGAPYILHPLRVMNLVNEIDEKIVAVLHDVIEDTYITDEILLEHGFPPYIVTSVASVSRKDGETWDDFIERAGIDPIGCVVKIADMRDNSDLFRMHELPDKHLKMIKKYHSAIKKLEPNHFNRIKI
jgi:hypothetical protein